MAKALTRWRDRGSVPADIAFWRQHLDDFRTPKSFALVISALLDKRDYVASLGLLMGWLSEAESLPLEENVYSFPLLATRWLSEVLGRGPGPPPPEHWPLVQRFFRLLGANAVTIAELPTLDLATPSPVEPEDRFAAAYEDVTYRDSAADDNEGALADDRLPTARDFPLERLEESVTKRMRFLLTQALLWQRVARRGYADRNDWSDCTADWLEQGRAHLAGLRVFLRRLTAVRLPDPLGEHDALVEYDRRRAIREQLLQQGIAACVELTLAVRMLQGASAREPMAPRDRVDHPWEPLACTMEGAMARGDVSELRRLLPEFIRAFRSEPLLYIPVDAGGSPLEMLRARVALVTLRGLVEGLPGAGLLRESYHLLRLALEMESQSHVSGRRVTEFDRLFQGSLQAVVRSLAASAPHWPGTSPLVLVRLIEAVLKPFLVLWMEHSKTLRLSILEALQDEDDWRALYDFIRQYGHDLFSARFMTLGNLRAILHRGIAEYLAALEAEPDPLHPIRLLEDLDRAIPRERAVRFLQIILQAVVDNYEEYKDYNTTTAQSDYGENLHLLLDFLRLKAAYDRHAWQHKPLAWAHEVLVQMRQTEAARLLQELMRQATAEQATHFLAECERLERKHALRLTTVADRIQGRFLSALEFDRLCAWVEPAVEEAAQGGGEAILRLEEELRPILAKPGGVGLDLPEWLKRLEHEVQRVRLAKSPLGRWDDVPAVGPTRPLSVEELREQIQEWERPLW